MEPNRYEFEIGDYRTALPQKTTSSWFLQAQLERTFFGSLNISGVRGGILNKTSVALGYPSWGFAWDSMVPHLEALSITPHLFSFVLICSFASDVSFGASCVDLEVDF